VVKTLRDDDFDAAAVTDEGDFSGDADDRLSVAGCWW
jgi:hypothetical protein